MGKEAVGLITNSDCFPVQWMAVDHHHFRMAASDVQPNYVGTDHAGGSKLCAFDLCRQIENLKVCGRCKGTWYCCKDHQKQHWQVHKKSCLNNIQASSRRVYDGMEADDVILTHQVTTPTNSNRRQSEVESTKVQEDIAQFSANIRRKQSCTLSPCDGEENSNTALIADFERGKASTRPTVHSRETRSKRENMPPNQPTGVISAAHPKIKNSNPLVKYVVEQMQRFGICVVDNFLDPERGDAILKEVRALRDEKAFHDGQLVTSREVGSASVKDIRGDMITWTDGSNPGTANIGFLTSRIDSVIHQCKGHLQGFRNINGRTEAMVACYPGKGTHYVKHVDNPNEDGRCVTCIYYLNKNWDSKTMGGSLQLYPCGQDRMASVDPKFNRLLFFWSDRRNPHEVLPAFNTRYAITVWYFDAIERKKALTSAVS